jgi:alkylhydroperoxidase/carboxymuconolactone decarboxylase family protein YurZ
MIPVNLRAETWANIQQRLIEGRMQVYSLYQRFGPCTTRELSERGGEDLSIFTIRPRTTELIQLGLVAMVGRKDCQGVYAAIPMEEAERNFQEKVRAARQPAQGDLFA